MLTNNFLLLFSLFYLQMHMLISKSIADLGKKMKYTNKREIDGYDGENDNVIESMIYKPVLIPTEQYIPDNMDNTNLQRRYLPNQESSRLQNYMEPPEQNFIQKPSSKYKYDKYTQDYFSTLQNYLNSASQRNLPSQEDLYNRKNIFQYTTYDTDNNADSDKVYKRVFNETVVEIIGDDEANNNTIRPDIDTTTENNTETSNESVNETQEFQQLLEEARKTKEQIEMLSAKLNDDSDDSTNIESNETTASKKSSMDSLQNDISVERGVRQLLVKHLIQVQIEDKRREEALENMIKHFPVGNKELKSWNMSQGAMKVIIRAEVNLMGPTTRLEIAKRLSRMRERNEN